MAIEKVDRTVDRLLDALGLATVSAQARLATSWEDVVGPLLATKTCPARLKGGILTVCAVSPPWAQELSLSRSTVLRRIDAVLGAGKVREVRVVVGPVPEDEPPAERGEAPPPPAGTTPGPGPEGIESLADPEMRRILASLSRKAAGKTRGRKVQGRS